MGSIGDLMHADGSVKDGVSKIIDIRSDAAGVELKQEIAHGLQARNCDEKTLPTLLLYDQHGLKLFEQITYLDEYYLTGQEISLLKQYADRIAERIPDHSMVVELGSGNLRKVKILLSALDSACKTVEYFALDLDRSELDRTLAAVPHGTFNHVRCFGLLGTYDDGLLWLSQASQKARPKTILSMGSSIGNFAREDSAVFLKRFAAILSPADNLLIGLDACQDPDKVFAAYNDRSGVTHKFTLNGLKHANVLLGSDVFELDKWETHGVYDVQGGRHRAFVTPNEDVEVLGVVVRKGEPVRIEESYKYSPAQASALWQQAGVMESAYWCNQTADYGLHMLSKPRVMFSSRPEAYASHPVPGLEEWRALWRVWDTVTRQMIPNEELQSKPIKLRNACIFYLGHIPTFLDIKLTQGTNGKPTEPRYYSQIFERGIDPDVDNPEHCHAHSEIPDEWPPLDEILQYQTRVRHRVESMYTSGQAFEDTWAGRILWLGFEHEVMHLETLLYMLLQSDKTIPPEGVVKPDFEQLAVRASTIAVDNQWFDIPEQTLTLGLDDPDTRDGPIRHFGWDIEKPIREVHVKAFKAKGRPLTNGEYAMYLSDTGNNLLPVSWTPISDHSSTNGAAVTDYQLLLHGNAVRTVFGPVPLKYALDWPVSASYDELAGCAKYMGGRIPTMEEARSIYEHVNLAKKKEACQSLQKTIPAVNGHLVNEGVEESPPAKASSNSFSTAATPDPSKTFANLEEANIGFKHWHPVSVTHAGNKLAGQAEMGGLWEWTSSALKEQDNFHPMELYPAYSADFFDGKHNVVLGGSWATHPRIAGRMSFVNWYQRNYPYVWAGARLVKDDIE